MIVSCSDIVVWVAVFPVIVTNSCISEIRWLKSSRFEGALWTKSLFIYKYCSSGERNEHERGGSDVWGNMLWILHLQYMSIFSFLIDKKLFLVDRTEPKVCISSYNLLLLAAYCILLLLAAAGVFLSSVLLLLFPFMLVFGYILLFPVCSLTNSFLSFNILYPLYFFTDVPVLSSPSLLSIPFYFGSFLIHQDFFFSHISFYLFLQPSSFFSWLIFPLQFRFCFPPCLFLPCNYLPIYLN